MYIAPLSMSTILLFGFWMWLAIPMSKEQKEEARVLREEIEAKRQAIRDGRVK